MKLLVSVILMGLAVFGGSKADTPEQLVKNFLKAVASKSLDVKALRDYITPLDNKPDAAKRNEILDFQLKSLHQELADKDLTKLR